jgi:hypothetical protein
MNPKTLINSSNNLTPPIELIGEVLSYLFKNGLIKNNDVKDVYSSIQIVENDGVNLNEKIKKIKLDIKNLVVSNLGKALELLKDSIIAECERYDEIIGLLSRYYRINKGFHSGAIEFELYDREIIKIEKALMFILNTIEDEYIKSK